MNDSLKRHKRYLIPQISPQQYFKTRLPFIHSQLPTQQSFITVLHKRKPNLIKMKQLHILKQKQQRMNITHLRSFVQQDKKIKRLGCSVPHRSTNLKNNKNNQNNQNNTSQNANKQITLFNSTSKLKLNSYFYYAMNAKLQENKRYFSLDK